jgi:ferredoxin
MTTEIFYFSGSGNSLFIAKYLGERLGNSKLTSIASLNNKTEINCEAQTIGIVFPVYFISIPEYVSDFLKRLKVGKEAYVFVIANAGETVGNTLIHTKKILANKSITMSAAFKVYLPDNSIFFATVKSKHELMMLECENQLKEIIKKIVNKELIVPDKEPIYYAKATANVVKFYCEYILGFDDFIVDAKACIGCGLCERVCPVQNIKLKEGIPKWEDHCTMCFACLHWCPKQAIELKKQKVHQDFQYTNPKIQVQEMIERNND